MENGQVVEAGSVLDVFGKPQAPVTRRFVQTVVNDQIPESILSLVKEQKEHFRVERLKFIGSSVKRPVIGSDRAGIAGECNVCVHFAADRNGRENIRS